MSKLTYETLIDEMLSVAPELRDEYETDQAWLGGDYLPHVTFGIVFNPYVEGLLRRNGDEEMIWRIFSFLEAMAEHDDIRIQEILGTTVCEHLSGQGPELRVKARQYMGPATRRVSHEIAVGWGHEEPYEDDPPEIKAMAPSKQVDAKAVDETQANPDEHSSPTG